MIVSKIFIQLGVAAGLLMGFVSLKGVIDPATYAKETANWAAQAMGQDYINLFLALPALLLSSYRLKRGSLRAFLVWLGLLIYIVYSYVLYAFFIHFGPLFLAYIAVLGLSFYALAGGLYGLDQAGLAKAFETVKTKAASVLLAVVGGLFYLLWLSDIIGALVRGGLPQDLDKIGLLVNPVQVLDLALLLPGAIIVAALLRRKHILGLVLAVPFLVFFSVMGIAIIVMMIVLTQKGFALAAPQLAAMGVVVSASLAVASGYLKRVAG